MNIFHVTTDVLCRKVKKLKSSTSPGPDGIPSVVFKKCINQLVNPLAHIFNLSLLQGKFPSQWKCSYMVPVHKKGDRQNVSNYRGITSLCACSKLFEMLLYDHLFFHTKCILSSDQHGFYPGRSVTTNLLCFTTSCIEKIERGTQVDAIYTDLKAAFDKIDHKILLCKLSKLGASSFLVKWLKSYLCNRKMSVKIGTYTSQWFENRSGVPQGSNLGPLLFALYFNDVAACLGVGCRLLYADDLKIYHVIKSYDDCPRLQEYLNKFVEWCRTNKMTISVQKCAVISFHRSISPIHAVYKIGNIPLERVFKINDLGVLLDSKLSFNLHRSDVIDRANRQLGFIMRTTAEFSDIHCLKSLYYSLVRSILESSAVVWTPYQVTWIRRIERIQKRFVRFALRLLPWRDRANLPPYEDRCCLLGIDTLERRRRIHQATFAAKILGNEVNCPDLLEHIAINAPFRMQRRTMDSLVAVPFHQSVFGFHEPISAICRTFNIASTFFEFGETSNNFKNRLFRSNLFYCDR